ncbi:MAG: 30S ribosomal protein S1 [Desulfobulbaceae bacterium]|nr:30S ribosomal protein S1 [Desulfobulbaceae bacterium]
MSQESFSNLFEEKTVSISKIKPGDKIKAAIAEISGENIFLDIGQKSEGVLAASELRDENNEISLKTGDSVEVYFLSTRRGEMIFTTRLGSGQTSNTELEEAFHSQIPVSGTVEKEIKGGYQVSLAGTRTFCPYSQMDIRRVEDPESRIGQTVTFLITEFSQGGRNIIVSARKILERERAEQRKELEKTLHEDMRIAGTVTSLRDFGAFVDIGGVDGLIPISELAWGRIEKVEEILHVGQQVEVIIKKLDWNSNRISLSLKATLSDPWDSALETYQLGSIHSGIVSNLMDFGAFVTLAPGIDGLLHISKLGAGRKIRHPREVLEQGQEITVRVEKIDLENKRISLEPEDYKGQKTKTENEKQEVDTEKWSPTPSTSMGTFADLLAKGQKNKKR